MINSKYINHLILPKECRVICISDIHGSFDLFTVLLNKCGLRDDDYLILLGDCIEKGNDSLSTFEYVKKLYKNRKNTYLIRGNVDFAPQCILKEFDESRAADYLMNRSKSIIHQWAEQLMLPKITRENFTEIREILYSHHIDDINFISNLPFVITTSDFIFAHTGADKDTLNTADKDIFFRTCLLMDGKSPDDRWVVFGHFPTFSSPLAGSSNNPIIFKDRKAIGIDGGNVLLEHGQLNALIINKSGQDIDFSYEFTNNFKIQVITETYESENDDLPILKCVYPPYEIIREEEYFYVCFMSEAGVTGRIKKERLDRNKNDRFIFYNNISNFLSVEKGEHVYIINDDCEGYTLVKNMSGGIGWVRKDCFAR